MRKRVGTMAHALGACPIAALLVLAALAAAPAALAGDADPPGGTASPAGEPKADPPAGGGEKKAGPEGEAKGEAKAPDKDPAAVPPPLPELDAETKRVLEIMDGAHRKIVSFQADYEQIRKVRISKNPRKSKGTFYLRKSADGKGMDVLFVETEPFRSKALFTDTEVVFLDEETGDVRRDDPRKGAVKPSEIWVMGRPVSEIRNSYDPKALPLEKGEEGYMAKLELVPRSEKIRRWVKRVVVWMRNGDGMGTRVRIVDKTGDYQEFLFDEESLKINPDLPDDRFKIG
jgi:outer membrane lipoprotein-sorting protein